MKTLIRLILMGGLLMVGRRAPAQEAGEVEQLRNQLQEMKASFERAQQLQREQIEALQKQLDAIQRPLTTSSVPATVVATGATEGGTALPASPPAWKPSDPIRVGSGGTYMDIGLVATMAVGGSTAKDISELELGGHDPNQQGFTLQGLEASFSGGVDPYFRGNANLLFGVDANGESFFELEEGWAETVSLPGNFQVRAGQILTDFGRVNTQHPHGWSFVDVPIVNARFLGSDGLRNLGARVSWLAPTPFYSEFFLAVQNSQGGTAAGFRDSSNEQTSGSQSGVPFGYRYAANNRGVNGISDMLLTPRLATSFELTDNQTLLAGVSAAFGPNSSGDTGDTRTEIYGTDLTWKWKSPTHHGGFPFVMWQSEAMMRRYALGSFDWAGQPPGQPVVLASDGVTPAVLGSERLSDWGLYSQLSWGFKPGWV